MNRKWRCLNAAAVLVVSALTVVPAGASEKCLGWTQTPVTVGVGGNPVISTPVVQAYVCREDTTEGLGNPDDLPEAYVTQHGGYYDWWWRTGTSINLYVPSGVSVSHLRITYGVGSNTQTTIIPVGVGGESGQTICVFYAGHFSQNPGGCQLYVEF